MCAPSGLWWLLGCGNVHTSEVRSHCPSNRAALGTFPKPATLPQRRTAGLFLTLLSIQYLPPLPPPQNLSPSRDARWRNGCPQIRSGHEPLRQGQCKALLTWGRSIFSVNENSSLGFGQKPGSGTDVVSLLAARGGGLGRETQHAVPSAFPFFVIVPGQGSHLGTKSNLNLSFSENELT